jgi:hypothetical protein
VRLPLVPVTVTEYAPAVVPAVIASEVCEQIVVDTVEPLHPLMEPSPAASRQTIASVRSARRLRTGSISRSNPASATPEEPRSHRDLVDAVVKQLLYGPAEVIVSVEVAVPFAARLRLPGETLHVGGWLVAGVTAQLSATVPANPFTEVPSRVHMLVVVVFATGVTVSVAGLAASVKLPEAAAASSLATSMDPSPVARS